ncbi:MAG TPA: DNA gyrase inhibitor YacG [Thermodesulfovibrionia bacterium]|nr:DNA gyrase inhibitor YacG [Thermodesulfovibrionia bacterium]
MKLPCPICKTDTEIENNPYRPFCSNRCKLIDLSAWLGEQYSIPAEQIVSEKQQVETEENSEV